MAHEALEETLEHRANALETLGDTQEEQQQALEELERTEVAGTIAAERLEEAETDLATVSKQITSKIAESKRQLPNPNMTCPDCNSSTKKKYAKCKGPEKKKPAQEQVQQTAERRTRNSPEPQEPAPTSAKENADKTKQETEKGKQASHS